MGGYISTASHAFRWFSRPTAGAEKNETATDSPRAQLLPARRPRRAGRADTTASPCLSKSAVSSPRSGPSSGKPKKRKVNTLVKGTPKASPRESVVDSVSSLPEGEGFTDPALTRKPWVASPVQDDPLWQYVEPPNNQRTFVFEEDHLAFSSEFDSGNLIHVERVAPYTYNLYNSFDCGNSPVQTNNRQWFHFCVRRLPSASTSSRTGTPRWTEASEDTESRSSAMYSARSIAPSTDATSRSDGFAARAAGSGTNNGMDPDEDGHGTTAHDFTPTSKTSNHARPVRATHDDPHTHVPGDAYADTAEVDEATVHPPSSAARISTRRPLRDPLDASHVVHESSRVRVTMVGMAYSAMYNYRWMPVVRLAISAESHDETGASVPPSSRARVMYTRLPGRAEVTELSVMPATPGYPMFVHQDRRALVAEAQEKNNNNNQEEGEEVEEEEEKDTRRGDVRDKTRDARSANPAGLDKTDAGARRKESETTGRDAANEDTPTASTGDEEEEERAKTTPSADSVAPARHNHDTPPEPSAARNGPEHDESPTTTTTAPSAAAGPKPRKKPLAMNLTFDVPLPHDTSATMYVASNHPYSFDTLQAHLDEWTAHVQAQHRSGSALTATVRTHTHGGGEARAESPTAVTTTAPELREDDIYLHREVLCYSLDGRPVELLTISDGAHAVSASGLNDDDDGDAAAAAHMPLWGSARHAVPVSSATGATRRPRRFRHKRAVVLTARVHAAECPSSHMMHGCLDFLLTSQDARARALRRHFVFYCVPMLNPDGVVRGHSRVDANGVDLNRTYDAPSSQKHPATHAMRIMLHALCEDGTAAAESAEPHGLLHGATDDAEGGLALYVDMHAHANKRGTFIYGNSMPAENLLRCLLYTRLIALNTPYFDFTACNFTEVNMKSVGNVGKSKAASSRVAMYLDTGMVHSYVIETSHVEGVPRGGVTVMPPPPSRGGRKTRTHVRRGVRGGAAGTAATASETPHGLGRDGQDGGDPPQSGGRGFIEVRTARTMPPSTPFPVESVAAPSARQRVATASTAAAAAEVALPSRVIADRRMIR